LILFIFNQRETLDQDRQRMACRRFNVASGAPAPCGAARALFFRGSV
jgi:hypothetical protein